MVGCANVKLQHECPHYNTAVCKPPFQDRVSPRSVGYGLELSAPPPQNLWRLVSSPQCPLACTQTMCQGTQLAGERNDEDYEQRPVTDTKGAVCARGGRPLCSAPTLTAGLHSAVGVHRVGRRMAPMLPVHCRPARACLPSERPAQVVVICAPQSLLALVSLLSGQTSYQEFPGGLKEEENLELWPNIPP